MNNNRIFLIFIAIVIAIISLSVLSTVDNDTKVIVSETGCCSIKTRTMYINDTIQYKVTYTQNEIQPCVCHSDFDSDVTICTATDIDSVINGYQDFCYTHHN